MTTPVLPDAIPWSKAAYPVWALVSGYAGEKRRKRRLVMLQAFIDDSGTGGPLLVMAGLVATAENWAAFSDEWDAVRRSGKPIAYLKMKEAFGLTDEFGDFDHKERDDKIYALIDVINKHSMLGAVCTIDAAAYEQHLDGGPAKTLDTPYFHACMTIIQQFAGAVHKNIGSANPIDFIFDRMNPKLLQGIVQMWWIYKQEMPLEFREMLGNHPRMDDGEKLLPLEAAELLAGCWRRAGTDKLRGIDLASSKGKYIDAINIPSVCKHFGAPQLAQLRQAVQGLVPGLVPVTAREESYDRKKRLEGFFNAYPELGKQ